jgi:hypothetical protein
MRIQVHIKERSFFVECGAGNPDIAWLALAASHRYGLEVFPRGRYIPCLISTLEGDVPHPRNPVSRVFQNDQEVICLVREPKDCSMNKE